MSGKLLALANEISHCRICADNFPHEPRPVVRLGENATILVVGQAPGRKVHATGIPFNDPSGDRLRDWMGVSREVFYDTGRIAILPMGFCYPGHGRSGDLPPRPECAQAWRQRVLDELPRIRLTLAIGRYAIDWHLAGVKKRNLTETVKAWAEYAPGVIPLPHPSPRNNLWLRRNAWFEADVLPVLRERVRGLLGSGQGVSGRTGF
ncbi:MAG TPA: uracil-DNA glycosylase family protein [Gammaproteobacteria bacterium]|nr:uracil-DNA glycosylase family protein [Gammaproteobacteria bacterium]